MTPTPTATQTSTPEPTRPPAYTDWALEKFGPPWQVDCKDDQSWNGYDQGDWAKNFCVPGLITEGSSFFQSPDDYYGLMSSYAEYVMGYQVKYRGLPPETRGIAVMSCADIGEEFWLRLPDREWEGPFIAVDCSGRNHLYYHMVGMGLAIEVSFEQANEWGANEWGLLVAPRIDVHRGSGPPEAGWDGPHLADWWVTNALEWQYPEEGSK